MLSHAQPSNHNHNHNLTPDCRDGLRGYYYKAKCQANLLFESGTSIKSIVIGSHSMSLLLHSPSVASIVLQLLFWCCTYIIFVGSDFFVSAFHHHSLSPSSIPNLHLHSNGSNNILSRLNNNMVSINNNNQHIQEARSIEDDTTNIKTDDHQLVDNNKQQQNNNNNNNETTTTNKRRERKRSKKEAARQRRLDRIAKNGGPPETTFVGKHKWLGGAVDPSTGKIYGIPSHSHQIICITPSSSEDTGRPAASISTIPLPNEYHEGHYKWLRGIIYNHNLYGIPAWSTKGVLKLDLQTHNVSILPLPNSPMHYQSNDKPIPTKKEQRSTTAGNPMSIDRGRWMWHGGAIGYNSKNEAAIYCPPSNAEFVLKVYLDGSDRVEEIGMPLSDGQNKWYGKFFFFLLCCKIVCVCVWMNNEMYSPVAICSFSVACTL